MTTTKRERPLSPHLQVYRWQITMTMSILHRATGVALSVGAFGLVWWLLALAAGPETHAQFASALHSPIGWILLLAFALCLVYHFFNGIRHLLWDIGWGFEIPQFYASGWTVLALTVLVGIAVCWAALATGGAA